MGTFLIRTKGLGWRAVWYMVRVRDRVKYEIWEGVGVWVAGRGPGFVPCLWDSAGRARSSTMRRGAFSPGSTSSSGSVSLERMVWRSGGAPRAKTGRIMGRLWQQQQEWHTNPIRQIIYSKKHVRYKNVRV